MTPREAITAALRGREWIDHAELYRALVGRRLWHVPSWFEPHNDPLIERELTHMVRNGTVQKSGRRCRDGGKSALYRLREGA